MHLTAIRSAAWRVALSPTFMWLVNGAPYPQSRWANINMDKFREIKKLKGGTKRAVVFFSENLGTPIHRTVVHSLLLQHDYMKRLPANGGARDVVRIRGIALLSGIYDSRLIERLNLPTIENEEVIAIAPRSERRSAHEEVELLSIKKHGQTHARAPQRQHGEH